MTKTIKQLKAELAASNRRLKRLQDLTNAAWRRYDYLCEATKDENYRVNDLWREIDLRRSANCAKRRAKETQR